MNTVSLIGNFTRDPEVRHTETTAVARFSLAVQRQYKKEGQPEADFINCLAFGKTAEFIEKYFQKGMRAGITGSIQTGSYTNKEGQKVYTTDVVVNNIEFVEKKSDGAVERKAAIEENVNMGFMAIPDDVEDSGLPFN